MYYQKKLLDIDKSSRNATSKENDLTLKTQINSSIAKLENSICNKSRVKQLNLCSSIKESKTIESIKMLSPTKKLRESATKSNLEFSTQISKIQGSPNKETSSIKKSPSKNEKLADKRTNFTRISKRFDLLDKNLEKCASTKQFGKINKNASEKSLSIIKNGSALFGQSIYITPKITTIKGNFLKENSLNHRLSDLKANNENNKMVELKIFEQNECETSQSIADMTCTSDLCEIKKTEDHKILSNIDNYTMIPKLQPETNKDKKIAECLSNKNKFN